MTGHSQSLFRVISWNLFHGRDDPPEPLGRLWWPGERKGEKYVQVNRLLKAEFARRIATWEWDVAFLQECPPRFFEPLAQAARAHGALVLTSRNWLAPIRRAIANWNPDAIASNEGGSNVILVRGGWRIVETKRLTMARRPERRTLVWARLENGAREFAVANMHLTAEGDHTRAANETLRAARLCTGWSGAATPLVIGGDLNLRPREHPWAFDRLAGDYALAKPTHRDAVDHLLARNVELVDPPRVLPDSERDVVRADGFRVRLSDHSVVAARYGVA
jgi:endonuclease/exonuclease/phosphatase family metal-dependent hydrolase